jgi:tRNA threonylcarbamoyladenosine biosynthesis protein TsaE
MVAETAECFETGDAEQTHALGVRLAARLRPGDVVGLQGPLGAGKTVLVRGLCAGLGVAETDVTSPTFAIVNAYRGRLPVLHVDLYRVSDLEEVEATGLLDLLDEAVALVEWVDRVPEILAPDVVPARAFRVDVEDLGGDRRRIRLNQL